MNQKNSTGLKLLIIGTIMATVGLFVLEYYKVMHPVYQEPLPFDWTEGYDDSLDGDELPMEDSLRENRTEEFGEEGERVGLYGRTCDESIEREIESNVNTDRINVHGGVMVNGDLRYRQRWNCNESQEDCDQVDGEEKNVKEVIGSNRFNIINGCLYDGVDRLLKNDFFHYIEKSDFFGNNRKREVGELLDEWFRIDEEDKVYVYLYGAAGCGGCFFPGPYIVIDKKTAVVQGGIGDIPNDLILSPTKKRAVETEYSLETGDTKLWLYELISNKRTKFLLEVPKDKTIVYEGDGWGVAGVGWEDDSTVTVQLYERDDNGFMKYEEIEEGEGTKLRYFESGKPIKINVDK